MIATTFAEAFEESRERTRNWEQRPERPSLKREELDDALASTIEAWLVQSYPLASGESTAAIYRKILTSFCLYLRALDLNLDSPESQLTPHIQVWARLRVATSRHQGDVAHSTYNQRIAAIHSFYTWARKCNGYTWANPAEQVSRTSVHKYTGVRPLDVRQVSERLKEIDRTTPRGQRDYALLQVALNTGRSARELAGLTWGSIVLDEEGITLIFKGGRNGKVMCDTLDRRLSQTLLTYLYTIYGDDLTALDPQAPIWISFSDRTYRQAIGQQTIADICTTHLGVSRIQSLRDTFALTMDQLGAQMHTIQARLGHEDRATTGTYLARLKDACNPYASALADAFGVE